MGRKSAGAIMVAGFVINAIVAIFMVDNGPKLAPRLAGFALGTLLMVIGLVFYSRRPAC
jgi:hypothetical protein